MNLEIINAANAKAKAEAIAGGMSEEMADNIFGKIQTSVESEAGKVKSKLDDFDKVVRQRDEAKEAAKSGEEASKRLKELENEGKTETEKLTARVSELEGAEAKVSEYEPLIQADFDSTVEALPENVRKNIPESGSLVSRLNLARSLKEAIGAPGPGPGGELPGGGTVPTIARADYNRLGSDGDLDKWSETKKKVASGELKIVD